MATTIVSATVIDLAEVREMAHEYFLGNIELCDISRAVSVKFAQALYQVLTDMRELARSKGARKAVQRLYLVQCKVLPNFFHYEKKQRAVPVQKPARGAQEPQQAEQPVKPPTKGGFERIHREFMDACRKGQQQRAAGFKGVIHNHYPQHEYAADQALAHYFPKK